MNDQLFQKHIGRRTGEDADLAPHADVDPVNDLGAFGWLRGQRERAVMLELRQRGGNVLAVGYAWLECVEFDPSIGITLHVAGRKVRITGRNLSVQPQSGVSLLHGLTRHRIPWIREADRPASLLAKPNATVVERIEW